MILEILPSLSGCDTVECCFGTGKVTVLKTVRSGHSLSLLRQTDASIPAAIKQATTFMTML